MSIGINDIDKEVLIALVTGADGDLRLAAERLDRILENDVGTTQDYALQSRLANLDLQSADQLATRFRTLLTVKLYSLIVTAMDHLKIGMADLRPSELARTTTSLTASFAALTAPATKVTFDFNAEIEKLAEEFTDEDGQKIPIEDIKAGLKEMEASIKARK